MAQYTEIPFSGINNTNPDTLNGNGEVAAAFGLTSNGAVAAAAVPTATHLYNLPAGAKILLIHSGSDFKNVFVYLPSAKDENDKETADRTVAYEYSELLADKGEDGNIITPKELCSESGCPTSTTTIGNIAVLSFADKLRYAYRTADGYSLRPCKIPPLQMEIIAACRKATFINADDESTFSDPMAPDGIRYSKRTAKIATSSLNWNDHIIKLPEQFDTTYFTNQITYWDIQKTVNVCLGDILSAWRKLGYLFQPVLIRAAYRLKTGELAGLTNPVLCFPFSKPMIAGICRFTSDGFADDCMQFYGVAYKLFAKFLQVAGYEEWRDIVDSVEIYSTPPICTYSEDYKKLYRVTSQNCEYYEGFDLFGNTSDHKGYIVVPREIGGLTKENLVKQTSFFKVRTIPFDDDINREADKWSTNPGKDETSEIAVYQKEIFSQKVTDTSDYSQLYGYRKLIDSTEPGTDIEMTGDRISARQSMTDQLRSNMPFTTNEVTSYNSRLLLAGTEYNLTEAANAQSYFGGCVPLFNNKREMYFGESGKKSYKNVNSYDRFETIPDTPLEPELANYSFKSGVAIVSHMNYGALNYFSFSLPTPDFGKFITCEEPYVKSVTCLVETKTEIADKGENTIKAGTKYLLTLQFQEHPGLSLSYFTGEYSETLIDDSAEARKALAAYMELEAKAAVSANRRISRSDYIRESDTADPYTFQPSNTAYLNSRVNRLLIVPEQISLGQYGQSQMYAVCDDGVYTVAVDEEGKLLSANTYTQDIIDHPERACVAAGQLTSNNTAAWDAYSRQQRTHLLDLARNFAFHFHRYPLIDTPPEWARWKPLLQGDKVYDFFRNAALRYDGRNNQLVAFRSGSGCIAALNADLGLTLLDCPADYEVNAKWLVLADNGHNIYEFPDADPEAASGKALIVTRPIHLGTSRDSLVTARKAVVHGVFRKDCVHTALYGTRDYIHWHLVASSKTERVDAVSGSGYKAFAVAVYADLKGGEHLTHISIEHEEKQNARVPY